MVQFVHKTRKSFYLFLSFFFIKREAEKLRKEREAGKQEENSVVSLAERELEQVMEG